MLSGSNIGNATHEGGMTRTSPFRWIFCSIIILCLEGAPASAQSSRTWVSGLGTDSGSCPVTSPCMTFAFAYSQTTVGGEIDVLSPGGYGALTITHSISIYDDGSGEAGILVAGNNGITVSAGPTDVVNLRGLIFNGTNASPAAIQILSAGLVTIQSSVIQEFTNGASGTGGVTITPGSGTVGVVIQNSTIISNNVGVFTKPASGATANVLIDHSVVNGNGGAGVRADATGGGTVIAAISNSSISLNAANGIISITGPGSSTVNVMNDVIFGNSGFGVVSNQKGGGISTVAVGGSMISNNLGGATDFVSGGALQSFATNQITGLSGTGFSSSIPLQ